MTVRARTRMNALVEWARRCLDRAFKWFRPPKPTVYRRLPLADRPKPTSQPRYGIRSTDLGMRKLRRHRSGRLYDRRSGFDLNKRMVDIEDNQTRKGKRKKGWHEDRKG